MRPLQSAHIIHLASPLPDLDQYMHYMHRNHVANSLPIYIHIYIGRDDVYLPRRECGEYIHRTGVNDRELHIIIICAYYLQHII